MGAHCLVLPEDRQSLHPVAAPTLNSLRQGGGADSAAHSPSASTHTHPTTPCAASRFHPFEADGLGSVTSEDPVEAEGNPQQQGRGSGWRQTVSSCREQHLYFCVYENQVLTF